MPRYEFFDDNGPRVNILHSLSANLCEKPNTTNVDMKNYMLRNMNFIEAQY